MGIINKAMQYLDDEEENINYSRNYAKDLGIPDMIPTEEQMMQRAILENVPGNPEIERINHLKSLHDQHQNLSDEEWDAIMDTIPDEKLADEQKRRLVLRRVYIENSRENLKTLASQNL